VGVRWKFLMWAGMIALLALGPAWYSLRPYQQRRVLVLMDPESDPQGSGWHITQSKIAVGSGEFFGKGYLKGTQTQLEFLPERTTDFIFCVLAEEGGFIICFFVIILYAFFLYNLLQVALRANDTFTALVSFGVAAMIFFHIFINIGMVIGILPVVGIPLPFLSYGGSALLSNVFAVGLVHAIHIRRRRFVNG
jgi:rod shape determining protein RodA